MKDRKRDNRKVMEGKAMENAAAGNRCGWERLGARLMKPVFALLPFLTLLYTNGFIVSANYGQNAANWMLDQVFWIALVAIIITVAALAAKRNNVAAISVLIVGAVVLYFIKNPTKLSDIGNSIMSNVLN